MTERDEEIGNVVVSIKNKRLIIYKFSLSNPCDFENLSMEESFFVDTLMRSAASYGETNGAKTIETYDEKYNSFLSKRGFETDESHAYTPMTTIVHYT